jgi:hypothetical protein
VTISIVFCGRSASRLERTVLRILDTSKIAAVGFPCSSGRMTRNTEVVQSEADYFRVDDDPPTTYSFEGFGLNYAAVAIFVSGRSIIAA